MISTVRLVSHNPEIQARYEECLENGCTDKLAEALAFREGPALRTDVSLLEGHSNGNQFAGSKERERQGNFYRKVAKRAGVCVQGKVYLSALANYPGDPKAWVSDRHDVERVLEENDMQAVGVVNRQARTPEREPRKPALAGGVAPDIIDREVAAALAENPEIAPTPKEKVDLREKIIEKRKPHWRKR